VCSIGFGRHGRSRGYDDDESGSCRKLDSEQLYYKQAVYDPKESKIGDIDDVLLDKSGKVTGIVVGVGGFLGAGEKDVIVPFGSVKTAKKNDKWWLTLDETKDDLKNAPGFKYDKASTTWVPEKK
jgi:sporulation protein YlmC with PRC-barrel domain